MALLMAQGIPSIGCGRRTWKTGEADRGLEADLSFYFDGEKIRVAREALARRSREGKDYPAGPDLAIEIVIRPAQVDRPAIDRVPGAVEVWRFNGQRPIIEPPQPDGTYAPSREGRFPRLRPEEVMAGLTAEDVTDQNARNARLFRWAPDQRGRA